MDTKTMRDALLDARRVVEDVQAKALASGGIVDEADRDRLGRVSEYIGQSLNLLAAASPTAPPERALVDDESWADLLSGTVGLAGRQKWLPGSTGIDLFVRRGTPVLAPLSGMMRFNQVPGGPLPIGEMVITHPDGRTVRFRHAQAVVANGQVALHQVVARVYDQSMDMLRWPTDYPLPPDGYQHLDLSLATRPEYLNPAGGAGGNVSAYAHVWGNKGGIPNVEIIARTPGPMEGSFGVLRAAWAQWAGHDVNPWETAMIERLTADVLAQETDSQSISPPSSIALDTTSSD